MRGETAPADDTEDSLGRRRPGGAAEATVPRSATASIWQTLTGAGSALVGAVSSTLSAQPLEQSPNRTRASAFALGAEGAAAAQAEASAPMPAPKQKMLRRRDLAQYVVESGDTLAGLALRFRTKVRTLKRCNPSIMGTTLFPGQAIRVPDGEGSPVPAPSPSPDAPPPLEAVRTEYTDVWFCCFARHDVALRKGTLTLCLDSVAFVATRDSENIGDRDSEDSADFDFVLATADIADCGALSHTHHALTDAAGGTAFGVSPSELPVQSRAYVHILIASSAPMVHEDLFLLLRHDRVLALVEALKEMLARARSAAAARAEAYSAAGARAKTVPPPPELTSPPTAVPASAAQLFASPRSAHARSAAAPSALESALFLETEADAAMLVPLASPRITPYEVGGAPALPPQARLPRLLSRGALFASDVITEADVGDIEAALPWAYKAHDWALVYSLHTHGSTLETFLTNAAREAPTLLLIRSAHDEVCGVFASEAWQYSAHFRGSGETFIFKCRDRTESRVDADFRPYRWTGANDLFCLATKEDHAAGSSISVGGGGSAFGLFLGEGEGFRTTVTFLHFIPIRLTI